MSSEIRASDAISGYARAQNTKRSIHSGLSASSVSSNYQSQEISHTTDSKQNQLNTKKRQNPFAQLHLGIERRTAYRPSTLAYEVPNRDFEWYQRAMQVDFIPQPGFGRTGDHWTSTPYYLRIDSVTGFRLPDDLVSAGVQLEDLKWRLNISLYSMRHAAFFGKTWESPLFDLAYVPEYVVSDSTNQEDGGIRKASEKSTTSSMNPLQVPVGAGTDTTAGMYKDRPPYPTCMPSMGVYYYSTIHDPYCLGIAEAVLVVDSMMAPPREFSMGWSILNLFPIELSSNSRNAVSDSWGRNFTINGIPDVSHPQVAASLKEPINPPEVFTHSLDKSNMQKQGSAPIPLSLNATTVPFFKGSPRSLTILAETAVTSIASALRSGFSSGLSPVGVGLKALGGGAIGSGMTNADSVLSPATFSALTSKLQKADDLCLTYRLFTCSDLRRIQHLFRPNELLAAGQGCRVAGIKAPLPLPMEMKRFLNLVPSFNLTLRSPTVTLPLEFEQRMLSALHFIRATYHTPPSIVETPEIVGRYLRVAIHNSKRIISKKSYLPLTPLSSQQYIDYMQSPQNQHSNSTQGLIDMPFGVPPPSIATALSFRGEIAIAEDLPLDPINDAKIALVAELVYNVSWRPWQGSSSSSYLETLVHRTSARMGEIAAVISDRTSLDKLPSRNDLHKIGEGNQNDETAATQPGGALGFPTTNIVASMAIRTFETNEVPQPQTDQSLSDDNGCLSILQRPILLDGSPQQILMLRGPGRSLFEADTPLFGFSTAYEAIHPAVHRDFVLTVQLSSPQAQPRKRQGQQIYENQNVSDQKRKLEVDSMNENTEIYAEIQSHGVPQVLPVYSNTSEIPYQVERSLPSDDVDPETFAKNLVQETERQLGLSATDEEDRSRFESEPFTRALQVHIQPDLFVHVNPKVGGMSELSKKHRVKHSLTPSSEASSGLSREETLRRLTKLNPKFKANGSKSKKESETQNTNASLGETKENDIGDHVNLVDDAIRRMLCDSLTATRKLCPSAESFVYLEVFFQNPFPNESVFLVCVEDPLMKSVSQITQYPAKSSLRPLRDMMGASRLRSSAQAAGMNFSTIVGARITAPTSSARQPELPPLATVEEIPCSLLGGAVDPETTKAYSFRVGGFETISIPLGFECPASLPPSPYLSDVSVRKIEDGSLVYFPKSRDINVYVSTVECQSLARLCLLIDLPEGVSETFRKLNEQHAANPE